MTGLDRDIFRATRRLTTLLNEACNHWNYLCPYLEKLGVSADRALEGYQKDYPNDVATIIAEDRKSAIRPRRNCDVGTAGEQVERFKKYCASNMEYYRDMFGTHEDAGGWDCREDCPIGKMIDKNDSFCDHCELVWAQMPYEEVNSMPC